jgi:general secretion pathway protein D
LAVLLTTNAWASEASKLYKQGRKAEKAGEIARAYLLFAQAAALDPKNPAYWQRAEALKRRAAEESQVSPQLSAALLEAQADAAADAAGPALVAATQQDLDEARKPLPPTHLNADAVRKDFKLNDNAKGLFEKVARAYGLDCVFDGDYNAGKPMRFELDNADYSEALHSLEAATDSFLVPISDKLFLVVKDTPQKRKEEEPYAAIIVPLPEPTTTQDLTAMITAVQQSCGIQKVAWDSHTNVVVMKDSVSKVLAARGLFEDLLHPRGQILFDMDIVEVNKDDMVAFGLTLPNMFPFISFSTFLNNVPSIASNLVGMLAFGGGASLFGIGIVDSTFTATLSKSRSSTLLHSTVRSLDGLPASLHVGEKYPVETSGFFGPSSFTPAGANVVAPPPSFTFEDLGLSVKATPHIHMSEEVTLTVEAEFKLLTGTSNNGVPVISNRSLKSEVRLKFGEWAVVGGLMQGQDARTVTGIAGLSEIPLLGLLTRNTTTDHENDEVLIMIRPTLITAPPDNDLTHVYRMGSETKPLTPL